MLVRCFHIYAFFKDGLFLRYGNLKDTASTIFYLHLRPEQIADTVILVGDPGRVDMVASMFDTIECSVQNFIKILLSYLSISR